MEWHASDYVRSPWFVQISVKPLSSGQQKRMLKNNFLGQKNELKIDSAPLKDHYFDTFESIGQDKRNLTIFADLIIGH